MNCEGLLPRRLLREPLRCFSDEEATAKPILNVELWLLIQPLLPLPRPRRTRYPVSKPLDDRALLADLLFALQSAAPWEMLLQEMRCASGMSCWRRLRDRQRVDRRDHEDGVTALPCVFSAIKIVTYMPFFSTWLPSQLNGRAVFKFYDCAPLPTLCRTTEVVRLCSRIHRFLYFT